jgi:hypothetical protein
MASEQKWPASELALKEFLKGVKNPYLFDIILKIYYLSVVLLVPIDLSGDT